jgi:hypothetical protein
MAVMALFMALFVAAPARAASGDIMNVETGLCLDGSISRDVRLNACNQGDYQQWTMRESPSGGDDRVLYHPATQKCLDGSISNGVRLNTCNGSEYQDWEERRGDPGNALISVGTRTVNETLCLDGSISEGVRLKRCNNTQYQRWY